VCPHHQGAISSSYISFAKSQLLDSSSGGSSGGGRWIGDYQHRLLLFLTDLEELRPRDLVPYFCSNPKSAYAVVRRLEKQGVLKRVGHGVYRVVRDAVRSLLRLPVRHIKGGVRRGSAVRSRDGTTPVGSASAGSTSMLTLPASTASAASTPSTVPGSDPRAGSGVTSAPASVRFRLSAGLLSFRRSAAGSAPASVSTAVGRVGYLGLFLDNVRWFGLDGRWHQLPRAKLLRLGDLDPGWSVGYAEVTHVVGDLVLDGVVVVYTNAEDLGRFGTGAVRVEYRPPRGFVRGRGVASTLLLAKYELVKAFRALAVVLGEVLSRGRLSDLYSWLGRLWGMV
jgi:hypothetical protein